jgi:hypothetical protein
MNRKIKFLGEFLAMNVVIYYGSKWIWKHDIQKLHDRIDQLLDTSALLINELDPIEDADFVYGILTRDSELNARVNNS